MPDDDITLANADEQIGAAWKEISAKYAEDEGGVAPAVEEAPAGESGKEEKPAVEKLALGRDEQGRFAKASGEAETPAPARATATAPAGTPVEGATTAQDDAGARDLAIPPSSWKAGAKAQWTALPPEIRAEITRREGDFLKGQHELLPDAQLGQSMRQVIEPYRMLIDSSGSTPEAAVASLLRTAAILRTGSAVQRQQALTSIAQEYGIPLPQAQIGADAQAEGQIGAQPQQFTDPRVDALMQQIQAEQSRRQQEESARIDRAVQEFETARDEKGQPLRPFLANVLQDMMPIVRHLRATSAKNESEILQEAYDRAVWANPETRAVVVKQQQDADVAKRREDNLRQVAEAKKAASVNVPRRASTPAPGKPGRMEDTIAEAARALGLTST